MVSYIKLEDLEHPRTVQAAPPADDDTSATELKQDRRSSSPNSSTDETTVVEDLSVDPSGHDDPFIITFSPAGHTEATAPSSQAGVNTSAMHDPHGYVSQDGTSAQREPTSSGAVAHSAVEPANEPSLAFFIFITFIGFVLLFIACLLLVRFILIPITLLIIPEDLQ